MGHLRFIYYEVAYFVRKIRLAILYFLSLFVVFLSIFLIIGRSLTAVDLALFLSLNYSPTTLPEALAVITVLLMELAPVMAFVEVRTLSMLEKGELRAKTYRDHLILVGCGRLGKRVATLLLDLEIPFLLIVLREDLETNEFVNGLLKQKVPVIVGDASFQEVLLNAKIDRARAIIIAVNNDALNHKIAYKARTLADSVKVIARVYDDEMANFMKISGFADEVLSSTAISARNYIIGSFIDVVTEIDAPILVEITPDLLKTRKTCREMEDELGVNILAINRAGKWLHDSTLKLIEQDILCIQAPSKHLRRIFQLD